MKIKIRPEKIEDIAKIYEINLLAFNQPNEAELVNNLRNKKKMLLSLVAESDKKIFGHILFTPLRIVPKNSKIKGAGLAPMAVLPNFQNRGIGSMLINEGLKKLKLMLYDFVVVLGHPNYYPRFGFLSASSFGIKCPYAGVPDEAFMIKELKENVVHNLSGELKYIKEFDEV